MPRRREPYVACVFTFCFLLLSSVSFLNACPLFSAFAASDGLAGRAIDAYTNKEPFSGRGANEQSDSFEPQEEIVLYADVTYNGDPVLDKIVSFEVRGPPNSAENVSLSLSDITGEDGIAQVSFIIPWPDPRPQESLFGVWTVAASVDIAGVVVSDVVSFKVGWLIELLYVATADLAGGYKTSFSREETMGFWLGIRNIAMTEKKATLVVSVFDALNAGFGMIRMENESIPPGESEYFLKKISIPSSTVTGQGLAVANALKSAGDGIFVPWCPEVQTYFWIGLRRDVAVLNVVPSTREAYSNQTVIVTVVVKNKGHVTESFNVSAYYDSALIGTLSVEGLASQAEKTLSLNWSLEPISLGEYIVRAEASPVPSEVFLSDNVFVDGSVTVLRKPGPSVTPPPGLDTRGLLALVFVLIVLMAALLVVFLIMLLACRRRRKGKDEDSKGIPDSAVLPLVLLKKCRNCGKEFSGAYTFCPQCMTFHGRDFE